MRLRLLAVVVNTDNFVSSVELFEGLHEAVEINLAGEGFGFDYFVAISFFTEQVASDLFYCDGHCFVFQKVVLCFRLRLSDGGSLFRYRNRINTMYNLFRKNSADNRKGPKTLGKP